MKTNRLLITGHNGFIGSVMAPHFLAQGYDVTGLDTGFFKDCRLVQDPAVIPSIRKDIRDLTATDLRDQDAIIHLAALSNDPIGNLNDGWTEDINFKASVRLAELAKEAGIRRFLFSSSCIMYGAAEADVVNEESPLDPKTEYARSKVKAEQAITALADSKFSPTFLRNGTVYGVSPGMRFDTVFNDLMGSAFTTGQVIVYSDGQPWRPVVHVKDVARAFQAVLEAPIEIVGNQAFNTGSEELNYRIIQLAEVAVKTVSGCELQVVAQKGADQRTYKADFSKFARALPNFRFQWNPVKGAEELLGAFRAAGLTREQYTDKRFIRLKWLRHLLETNQLNQNLRWTQAC